MPVTSHWYDDEQTIIIYEFSNTWTWPEYDNARAHCRQLLDSVDYGIDQVYDFSSAPVPPKRVLNKFWQAATTTHENTSGLIVVVGTSKLVEMLTNSIGPIIQRAARGFDISYIRDRDLINEQVEQRRKIHRQ